MPIVLKNRVAQAAVLCGLLLLRPTGAVAQIQYNSGQSVVPIFEGWLRNSDGSISFVFAYLNRNYKEEVDIPVGPENQCTPAPLDCGQPTHFLTGALRRPVFVFRVPIPKAWPKDKTLLWTLKSRGQTESAKGWLLPEYEIDFGTLSENGSGGILAAGNQPPVITGGSPAQTVTLPAVATLTVTATDDGIPKPAPVRAAPVVEPPPAAGAPPAVGPPTTAVRPRPQPGVRFRWVHYRGPIGGKVTFDPATSDPVYGQPVTITTKTTFTLPGTYVLRAIASDRQLETPFDVTVTVNGSMDQGK